MESLRHPPHPTQQQQQRNDPRENGDCTLDKTTTRATPDACIRNGGNNTTTTIKNSSRSSSRPPPQHHVLRMELRKGVRFAQRQQEQQEMRAAIPREDDSQDETDDLAPYLHHYDMRQRSMPVMADEEDDDEMAEFLGLNISIPSGPSMMMAAHSSLHPHQHHKAASFSGSARPRMVPCSPPVPIPQKHWQRRNSTTSVCVSSGSMLIPSHDHEYSRSQCEARLWDEYWNYKLSLESRESFEASSNNNQRDSNDGIRARPRASSASINHAQGMKLRTDSEASTEDTARDSGEEAGCGADGDDDGESNVFDMDDF